MKHQSRKTFWRHLLKSLCEHKVSIIEISERFHSKEKKELMNLVLRNLEIFRKERYQSSLLELKRELGLKIIPFIIDCFDVSNFGTTFAVGSRTRFVNGKPNKEGYRRYKINTIFSQNDFAMISEIVTRSYSSVSIQDKLPDLIVIDGGKRTAKICLNSYQRIRFRY